jgi:hypothetical protein
MIKAIGVDNFKAHELGIINTEIIILIANEKPSFRKDEVSENKRSPLLKKLFPVFATT